MLKIVVDSWPVMEWAYGREPVASRFRKVLESAQLGEVALYMSRMNLGEIIYSLKRELPEIQAEIKLAQIAALPISLVSISDADIHSAADIKALYRCSYADTFAVVLANALQAPVLTGDREFLALHEDGLIDLEWIGA